MKSKSFRLNEEAVKNLAELAEFHECSEAKIINILLTEQTKHYNLTDGLVGPTFADDIVGLHEFRVWDDRQERLKAKQSQA